MVIAAKMSDIGVCRLDEYFSDKLQIFRMPGGKAPRFTQKPSIKQTAQGDLLMECSLEAQPTPKIKWYHGTDLITPGGRYTVKLEPKTDAADMFTATLLITVSRGEARLIGA